MCYLKTHIAKVGKKTLTVGRVKVMKIHTNRYLSGRKTDQTCASEDAVG